MLSDKVETLKAVVLYIIQNSSPNKRDVYSIVKTAYFAQINHLIEYGSPIFEDKICALPFGAVPSSIYDILKLARSDKEAYINMELLEVSKSLSFNNEFFGIKELPNLDYLSTTDISSLNYAINKVALLTFDDIVGITHNKEWQRANKTQGKEINIIEIAKEEGADEDIIAYISHNLEINRYLQ